MKSRKRGYRQQNRNFRTGCGRSTLSRAVYVCAPSSTIDPAALDGQSIHIEERPAYEITDMWYREPMTPAGVKVYNPAFDVTDHDLITAIVTEFGIVKPPYTESLSRIMKEKR